MNRRRSPLFPAQRIDDGANFLEARVIRRQRVLRTTGRTGLDEWSRRDATVAQTTAIPIMTYYARVANCSLVDSHK
jgi:hypothetical protein